MVAIIITTLVGVGAFTIDLGALYAEKRQLQNGADAAALAVAQDCAQGDCRSFNATAATYADLNAHDGASAVDAVCGNGPGLPACTDPAPSGAAKAKGWVRVKTSTEESDGGHQIHYIMAPVMNAAAGGTVRTSAVTAWGTPTSGAFVPFVVSICEFEAIGGSFDGLTFPSGKRYIYYHGKKMDDNAAVDCIPSPSGQRIPGGFGRADSVNCVASFVVGQSIGSDPGNDLAKDCPLAEWQGQEIVIAMYDQAGPKGGNNGSYRIVGFVGFTLLGYRLGGNRTYATSTCPLVGNSSDSYFCGTFTKVSLDKGDFGSGTNYGATVIKMVG